MRISTVLFLIFVFPAGIFAQLPNSTQRQKETLTAESRRDFARSIFYYSGTEDSSNTSYRNIITHERLKDTTIHGKRFTKILCITFKDSRAEKTTFYEFEHLVDREYILLDEQGKTIHQLNLDPGVQQKGIIFGKTGQIQSEFKDIRSYVPKEKLVPDSTTPVRFFIDDGCQYSVTYRPDYRFVVQMKNCGVVTGYLNGEIINELTSGSKNIAPVKVQYNNTPGDEIQVLYRYRTYNNKTGMPEFLKKQTLSMVYRGDTVINDRPSKIISIGSYNFLSGAEKSSQDVFITTTDSGFFYNQQIFIPTNHFGPIFKVDSSVVNDSAVQPAGQPEGQRGMQNFLSFSAYVNDTLSGEVFTHLISLQSNNPYVSFIPAYFPIFYLTFPGVEAVVTYVKKAGKTYGEKVLPAVKTDETNIRKITCLSKNTVQVEVYFKEPCEAKILFSVDGTNEATVFEGKISQAGLRTIVVNTEDLKENAFYQIQLEASRGNDVSSFITNFPAKY